MLKRCTLALAALLLVGCAARINRTMESWQGHHYHELIAKWGPPSQVLDDGNGGRILSWSSYRETLRPQSTSTIELTQVDRMIWGSVETERRPGYGYRASRTFWVSKSGRIYRWAWRGF